MLSRNVLAAVLLATATMAGSAAAVAQNRRVPPVDRCASNPSFVAFRTRLRAAIARRDGAWLLSNTTPNIEYSFGDSPGRAGFARAWGLNRPVTSRIWRELGDALRLGCDRAGDGEYWAPSLSLAHDDMDEGEGPPTWLAVGPNAVLHEGPSDSSPVVTRLEWDVLTPRDGDEGRGEWVAFTSATGPGALSAGPWSAAKAIIGRHSQGATADGS